MTRYSRLGKRDRLVQSLAGERAMAAYLPPDHPKYAASQARLRELEAAIPPKRERVVRPVDQRRADDTEASVINAVGDLLHVHPKVLFAVRQNTGSLPFSNSGGDSYPVWFYKTVRLPGDMTIVDYWGFLSDKRPIAFECKRPTWKPATPSNRVDYARERKQETFMHMIRSLGGVAGFVTDATQVQEMLK